MRHARTKTGEIVAKLADELHPQSWTEFQELRREVRQKKIIDRNDPNTVEAMLDFAEGELIRRAMRQKDDEGFPLFPSILVPTKDGEKRTRRYMREQRMKPIHYKQFGGECHGRAVYWMRLENAAYRRCNIRYNTQLELPWPDVNGQADQGPQA